MMTNETEFMCDRCHEAPAQTYNHDHEMAVCETCHSFYDKHNCAGDHCYCIGGDENFDSQNEWEPNDMMADAEALASAGFGTDEDYGYFGGEE